MRITANTYNIIRKINSGLYCWADLDDLTVTKFSTLRKIFADPSIKWSGTTDLHSTVVYHPTPLPPIQTLPPTREVIQGRVKSFEIWVPEKPIIVAVLDCPTLVSVHDEFMALGLTHGFETYDPHITIAKILDLDAATPLVDDMNEVLNQIDFDVEFDPRIKLCAIV